MKLLGLILLIIALAESKLYQVVYVFRHGARYHLHPYYDGNSTYDVWSEITPVGMRQHENLGKKLRQDYIKNLNFLNPKFNKKEFEIYSTDTNRTISSAISQLYGLYPPGNGPQIQKVQKKYHLPPFINQTDIDEQKFAFPLGYQHVMIKFNDTLLLNQDNCPKMHELWQPNYKKYSLAYEEMNLTYSPLLKKMISLFNLPSNATFQTISDVYDVINVDKYLGRSLPANFTQADFLNLQHIYTWLNYLKYTNIAGQVSNSRKYDKIIKEFESRIANLKGHPLKWTAFSCHDNDLYALHNDLNLSSFECVQDIYRKGKTDALNCITTVGFAANLIVELHSDNDRDFYVMVRANGKYMNLCEKQSTKCDWADFKNRIKRSIINNVQQVCGVSKQEQKQY